MKQHNHLIRYDLQIIASWIQTRAKVLDLGCGEGDLLTYLKTAKQVRGAGIERQEAKVRTCIAKGLTVLQGDINRELDDYQDNSFDYVIVSQTLQQVYEPAKLIREALRVGRHVVVSFPNFSYWLNRLHLLYKGRAPVSQQLPFDWYNTPNIRVITISDFKKFARTFGFRIVKEAAINTHHHDRWGNIVHLFPNLRATYGIFLLRLESPPALRPSRA